LRFLELKSRRAVGFVFGENHFRLAGSEQPALSVLPMLDFSTNAVGNVGGLADDGASKILAPGPGVCETKALGASVGEQVRGRDCAP